MGNEKPVDILLSSTAFTGSMSLLRLEGGRRASTSVFGRYALHRALSIVRRIAWRWPCEEMRAKRVAFPLPMRL